MDARTASFRLSSWRAVRGDEHQHVAIDTRRAAALHQDVLGLDQSFRAFATVVRMGDTQHNSAYASRLIRHFRRRCWCNLHGVEMPTISETIHILAEFAVDRHQDEGRLDLRGLVRRDAIEAR
jgi:hypothetical protein